MKSFFASECFERLVFIAYIFHFSVQAKVKKEQVGKWAEPHVETVKTVRRFWKFCCLQCILALFYFFYDEVSTLNLGKLHFFIYIIISII